MRGRGPGPVTECHLPAISDKSPVNPVCHTFHGISWNFMAFHRAYRLALNFTMTLQVDRDFMDNFIKQTKISTAHEIL